jgi:hypothetical protein
MNRPALIVLSVLALGLGACDDPEAPARCEEFRDAYCARYGEHCGMTDVEGCVETFDETVVCDDVIGTDAEGFSECLADIARIHSCPVALPASCNGVLYFPEDYESDDDSDDEDDEEADDAGAPVGPVPDAGSLPPTGDAGPA